MCHELLHSLVNFAVYFVAPMYALKSNFIDKIILPLGLLGADLLLTAKYCDGWGINDFSAPITSSYYSNKESNYSSKVFKNL